MSSTVKQAIDMMEMLPEEEQLFAVEMLKRLVLAWDPDFTRVTPDEKAHMDIAEKELENGEYVTEEEVWKSLDM